MSAVLARFLDNSGSYDGFDAAREPVQWCQDHISSRFSNFRFRHVDTFSPRYNPAGKVRGVELEFPYDSNRFDVTFAASVYTHMLPEEIAHFVAETARVLRPGGHLALFWNSRDLDDPVQSGVEQLLRPIRGTVATQLEGGWRKPLERSPLFGPLEERSFGYEQRFTADDLCDRVASTSYVAALSPLEREELMVRVRALTHGLPEPFPFPYKTEVYVIARLS